MVKQYRSGGKILFDSWSVCQPCEKSNGEIISDSDQITQEVKQFYENLYASRESDIKSRTVDELDLDHPELSDEERDNLEGNISIEELTHSVKNLNNGKSPGSDGYTAEFYKFFFADLKYFLLRSINYGFQEGEMSVTQKQGVITCIPKEGKDKRYLKNWRPITLLNTSYKIASSCIAERIKSVLPNIIHKDQTGFIRGRYIGENTRLLYDTLSYANKNNINGLLLSLDFEKAFDSIAWSFIQKALLKFNFGNDIRRWVETFYRKISSCISVNGQYSRWFEIQRGTRQGDPLSPYLFVICAEIMSVMIRQNQSVKGIQKQMKKFCCRSMQMTRLFFLMVRENPLMHVLRFLSYSQLCLDLFLIMINLLRCGWEE